ncbi:7TM diverse intracellular signaling domain-containing protein [Spirochaetota bacterium]
MKVKDQFISAPAKTKGIFSLIMLILAILILVPPNIKAQEVITLSKSKVNFTVTKDFISIFEDKTSKLTIDDILSDKYRQKFKQAKESIPNFGYTKSAIWIKLQVTSQQKLSDKWYLKVKYALLDYVSFFQVDKEGKYSESKVGLLVPFKEREIGHRNFIFSISLKENNTSTIYLRVVAQNSLTVPMSIMDAKHFSETSINEQIILGIFYGFIIIMILYNLFIYITVTEKNYLYLVVFLLSFLIYIMSENGIAYQYLWPSLPWWGKHVIPFSVSNVIIWSSMFVRDFLQTNKSLKTFDKIIRGFLIAGIIGIPLSLTVSYFISIIYVVVVIFMFAPVIIIIGFIRWRQKYRPALFFLIAWSAIALGSVGYALKAFGLLSVNLFSEHGVLMGASIQAMLLSIALADKINIMTIDLKKLKVNLEKRTDYLLGIMEKTEAIAFDVRDISNKQIGISQNLGELSQNQAAHAEEMSASYEELTASTESIDNTINKLSLENEDSRNKAEILIGTQDEVKTTSNKVMLNISNIVKFTEKTELDLSKMTEKMEIINEGGKAIINIISMIDDINDKINLLSLNAAIEAARAGEHGRGFAVVADEIGKLATATSDNSKQISSQIEEISQDIESGIEIVAVTKKSTSDVAQLIGTINKEINIVRMAMEKQEHAILQLVKQTDITKNLSKQVATSTNEQKTNMDESAKAIQNLSEMAQNIASTSISLQEFTKLLESSVQKLMDLKVQ